MKGTLKILKIFSCNNWETPMCQVLSSILSIYYRFNHHNKHQQEILSPPAASILHIRKTEVRRILYENLNCFLKVLYSLLLTQTTKAWQLVASLLPLDLTDWYRRLELSSVPSSAHTAEKWATKGRKTPLEAMAEKVEADLSTPFQGSEFDLWLYSPLRAILEAALNQIVRS